MSLFDKEDVEVEGTAPTWAERTQQAIAKQQMKDFDTYFRGTEQAYMGRPGDPASGLAAQSTALGSKATVAADSAQSVYKAQANAGPAIANRGNFAQMFGKYGETLGSAYAGGMADAEVSAETDINARLLSGLAAGMGLGADVSRSSQQAAGQAAQRGISIAQAELENNIAGMQGKSQLISDVAGLVP